MAAANATDAIEHYQSQVPAMRSKFAERLRQAKLEFQRADRLFSADYPPAIYALAESELRDRARVAADSLMQAIDAGWHPTEDEVRQTFVACFNPNDYRRESYSDIKQAVSAFTSDLGKTPDAQVDERFAYRIGEVQVEAANERLAQITMYLRKSVFRSAPLQVPSIKDWTDTENTLESADLGDRIIEYLGQHGSTMPSATVIARDLNMPEDDVCDEVTVLDSKGLLKVVRPDGYSVANGRFDISDRARALLAQRRKSSRERNKAKERSARLAHQLIESDLREDRPKLANAVQNAAAESAAKGIGASGAMIFAVEKIVVQALRRRSDRAVDKIKEVAGSGSEPFTSEDLAGIFDFSLDEIFRDGEHLLLNAAQTIGGNVVDQRRTAVTVLRSELQRKARAELELFAEVAKHGKQASTMQVNSTSSSMVFVTHGRDRATRDAVTAFLYSLKLDPIVLEDQANAGLTIIEKYEKYSKAGYGIAILSPDDVGCLKGESPEGLKPRARQNVIFELGYMFANISRHRVAVLLTDPDIERPTNIDGIAWIALDQHDGWKHRLVKELRAAGLPLRE